jgi:uncharacterized ion transporter superfamily protein YfcC
VTALVTSMRGRTLIAIPLISVFFSTMGALENMQEEIIPLVPVLLLLGRGLGVDAVAVVAMSAGAAMVGSAFGPTNPFQAGIAMKIAQLPPLAGGAVRLATWIIATVLWIAWTVWYAHGKGRVKPESVGAEPQSTSAKPTDLIACGLLLGPMALYVWGAAMWGWGFNELSAGFLIGALLAGLVGGLTIDGTIDAYLKGMAVLLPAAVMIGVARSISLVLSDGRVIDTILFGLSQPLATFGHVRAALAMIPLHMLVHIPVSSVSGQAVLTMPVLVPLSDLVGVSRQAAVMAYQTGSGLTELLTPTNGSLMAILVAAGVPFPRWFRFCTFGVLLLVLVGAAAVLAF